MGLLVLSHGERDTQGTSCKFLNQTIQVQGRTSYQNHGGWHSTPSPPSPNGCQHLSTDFCWVGLKFSCLKENIRPLLRRKKSEGKQDTDRGTAQCQHSLTPGGGNSQKQAQVCEKRKVLGSFRNKGKQSVREFNCKNEAHCLLRVMRHKFLPSGNAAMVSEYQRKGMEKFVLARTII